MADSFLRINESTDQFYRRCTNLSSFDCSEEEMLWWMMGPRRLPLQEIVPISVVLLVIFLTGVAGNVAVCVVIVKHPPMHTATNYYLFSLALSDLLLLLFGLPNDLSVYWHQYPYSLGIVFCKLRALISEAKDDIQVRAGTTFYYKGGKLYDIVKFVIHEKYDSYDFEYDIGIIKIAGKIEINGETTKIIKLPEAGSNLKPGTMMSLSGWGDTSGYTTYSDERYISVILKAVNLPVVDREHCSKVYGMNITENLICAGYKEPGQSGCTGDSGGAFITEDGVQYGVLVFGSWGCMQPDKPNGFTNVAALRDWIEEQTGV